MLNYARLAQFNRSIRSEDRRESAGTPGRKRTGHVLTISVQNITELWSEITRMGRYYADHVFDCYECFIQTGFTPVQRMNIPLTWEQFAGFDVKKAKERKRLLGVVCDLLIMKKEIVEYTKRFT